MQCTSTLAKQLFLNPRNVGDATEPSFIGRSASFQCGASLQISINIDDTSQRITEAKFRAAGCTALVAAASLLTEEVAGKTTGDAAELAQRNGWIEGKLETIPAVPGDCINLAREALVAAVRKYSDAARDEWNGEDALICTCFGVSEPTIERKIAAHQLHSVAEVTKACNAGAGCRSCWPLIEDMLTEVNRKW
ncbi:MAG TPA: iron-sulfur cluster assembly scaffold protein [Pyrinomonadaceae bacterium]|nr:iron-sulfur cluster assembly scaffold protein [Pyrinomonadaceae bacterium]